MRYIIVYVYILYAIIYLYNSIYIYKYYMLHSLVVKNDTMIHNVIDNIYVYSHPDFQFFVKHLGNFSSASHAELPTKEALAVGPRGPQRKGRLRGSNFAFFVGQK